MQRSNQWSYNLLEWKHAVSEFELRNLYFSEGCADGFAKESTEIQNIQIAEGDIQRNLTVPLFMVFPRLFTCPTLASKTFRVEFEINLVVMLGDGHLITENFPIKLVRCDDVDSIGSF